MDDEEQVSDTLVTEEIETETEEEESVDELRARLASEAEARTKADELANNYKARAEKAESKLKQAPKPQQDISSKDLYALIQAQVPQEDIDEVQEYAKMKKLTIAEALKSNVVKTILADAAEMRKTAQATATGTGRRVAPKVTNETILERAEAGDLPESDSGIDGLVAARLEAKKAQSKG